MGPTVAQAQLGDFLRRVLPASAVDTGRSDAGSPVTPPAAGPGADAASVLQVPPVGPSARALAEMQPDVECARPIEQFDLTQKLLTYGGHAAQLRLQRLVETDFAHSELKAQDKALLQYLAQTTVWVPPWVEVRLGEIFDSSRTLFGLGAPSPTPEEQMALDELGTHKTAIEVEMKIRGFTEPMRLVYDKDLADGAYARFGGVILLSPRFLNGLLDAGDGARFLMSHEMSHVYKRHALKNLQFQLISSAEGWSIAREVLVRLQRGNAPNVWDDVVFTVKVVPALIDFVRKVQLSFTRDQEHEADACSVVWLKASSTDPMRAWEAYQASLGSLQSYTQEHPNPQDRALNFKARVGAGKSGVKNGGATKGTVKGGGGKVVKDALKAPPRP